MRMNRSDLVSELAAKTGFYKKNMREVVDALEEIMWEVFQNATYDEKSELVLMEGVVIGGTRVPEHPAVDPRNGDPIMACERIKPYVRFNRQFKDSLKVNE